MLEQKCWGVVEHLPSEKGDALVSILHVEDGWRCSRHLHEHRWNSFRSISGRIDIVLFQQDEHGHLIEYMRQSLASGGIMDVPPECVHCFEVIGKGVVVETYWTTDGTPVDLNDIVRFDVGGRI